MDPLSVLLAEIIWLILFFKLAGVVFVVCFFYFVLSWRIFSIFFYCHHYQGVLQARIFLTFFRHSSLSSIALGRFSMLHPESIHKLL